MPWDHFFRFLFARHSSKLSFRLRFIPPGGKLSRISVLRDKSKKNVVLYSNLNERHTSQIDKTFYFLSQRFNFLFFLIRHLL
ncbi:hypothetical protein PUN28_016561 [Cardiocondyla obscurior]|uniref:Uncharacterized protein n=1 Tax=Cardiocondyla obscurior TaxID=286306 RepID=A0AAW2EPS9_9HYME